MQAWEVIQAISKSGKLRHSEGPGPAELHTRGESNELSGFPCHLPHPLFSALFWNRTHLFNEWGKGMTTLYKT